MVKPLISHVLGELSSYLDGRLNRSDLKRVESHLGDCRSCQSHLAQLRAMRGQGTRSAYTGESQGWSFKLIMVTVIGLVAITAWIAQSRSKRAAAPPVKPPIAQPKKPALPKPVAVPVSPPAAPVVADPIEPALPIGPTPVEDSVAQPAPVPAPSLEPPQNPTEPR